MLSIITAPDPLLRRVSHPVESITSEIVQFMDDMLATMYENKGVGLAAIQVGLDKRILILDLQGDDEIPRLPGFYPLFIVNPEILKKSEVLVLATEGCLSLPQQRVEIARSESIKLRYLNKENQVCELEAAGWLARAIQHEMDHLDGKLAIDYLSDIKKDMAMRKLKKLKKHYE